MIINKNYIIYSLASFFDLPELGWRETSYLFELVGQVGRAAVMKFVGDLGESKTFLGNYFLYPFYLLADIKFFDGNAQLFGEQIGHIDIVMLQRIAQIDGQVINRRVFGRPDDIQDGMFYFLDEYAFYIFEQFEPYLL